MRPRKKKSKKTREEAAREANEDVPLMLLPAELRNRIWEMVVITPNGVEVERGNRWVAQPALTRVSHAIRFETLRIYYGSNTFSVRCRVDKPTAVLVDGLVKRNEGPVLDLQHVLGWLRNIGADSREMICRLRMRILGRPDGHERLLESGLVPQRLNATLTWFGARLPSCTVRSFIENRDPLNPQMQFREVTAARDNRESLGRNPHVLGLKYVHRDGNPGCVCLDCSPGSGT